MTDIITELSNDPEKAKKFTEEFLKVFLEPSFSALSKTEIDNQVFKILVNCDVLDKKGQIYKIAKQLNITPTKARNLLFQYELRESRNQDNLRQEIAETFDGIKFVKDGDYISIGIESPILKEEIKSKFKELGHFPDNTFASEILRISSDSLIDFIDSFLEQDEREALKNVLIRAGHIPDSSFKGMTKNVLKVLAKVAAGKAGEELAGQLIESSSGLAINFLQSIITAKPEELAETVDGLTGFTFV